jgi:phosphonate transport system substrate-binding protein
MSGLEHAARRSLRQAPTFALLVSAHARYARTALLILLCAFSGTLHAAPPGYSFAVAPQQYDQRRLVAIWQPILDELTRRTGLPFTLTGAPHVAEFNKRFVAGQYDFAYTNPYRVSIVARQQGYQALVRDHAAQLCGVLVVRRDSPLRSPRDLDGKTIAFSSPNAFGSSLLVRADLANTFHVHIVPRYVRTHTSVYLQVAQGLADAGGGVQSTFDSQPQAVRDRLRVIHTTTRVPPHPVVAHPRVPLAVQNKVRQAFLDMGMTPAGQALLAAVPIKRIGVASAEDYAVIEQLDLKAFYADDSTGGGGTTPGVEEVDRVGNTRSRPRREHAVDDSTDGGGRPRREHAVEADAP